MKFVIPKPIIWGVWLWLTVTVIIFRFFLATETPTQNASVIMMIPLLAVPMIISIVFRWLLIPKLKHRKPIFVAMIIGMAMGESISFYGYFLFQKQQDLFFIISLLLVLQYIPIYLNKRPADVKDMSRSQA